MITRHRSAAEARTLSLLLLLVLLLIETECDADTGRRTGRGGQPKYLAIPAIRVHHTPPAGHGNETVYDILGDASSLPLIPPASLQSALSSPSASDGKAAQVILPIAFTMSVPIGRLPYCPPDDVTPAYRDSLGIHMFWNLWNTSHVHDNGDGNGNGTSKTGSDVKTPCTIFAVNDDGFRIEPQIYRRLATNLLAAREFLSNHIRAGIVTPENAWSSMTTAGGQAVNMTKKTGVTYMNDVRVKDDVRLPSGGHVYVVIRPLCCTSATTSGLHRLPAQLSSLASAILNGSLPVDGDSEAGGAGPRISYLRKGRLPSPPASSDFMIQARRLTLAGGQRPTAGDNRTAAAADGISRYVYQSPANVIGVNGSASGVGVGVGGNDSVVTAVLPGLGGTTFLTLLQIAGCRLPLSGSNEPVTVFLPTDEAVANLPPRDLGTLVSQPDRLRQTLLYHIAPGTHTSDAFSGNVSITTVQGRPLRTDTVGNGTMKTVEGAKVILSDIVGHDGVIHIIDRFLYPVPDGTTWNTVKEMPDLTRFLGLVDRLNLTDYLKGDDPYTVFAPTNKAIDGLTASIPKTPEGDKTIRETLINHLVPGIVYTASWSPAKTLPTVGGRTVYLQYEPNESGGFSLLPNGATVLKSDIGATNGVIHIIDDVMPVDYVHPVQTPRRTFWQNIWDTVLGLVGRPKVPTTDEDDEGIALTTEAPLTRDDDVVSILKKLPNAKRLLEALNKTDLVDKLRTGGPYTVFVPVDSAFERLRPNFADLSLRDRDQAEKVLLSHIVPKELFCDDLKKTKSVDTLDEGTTLQISPSEVGCAKVDDTDIIYWNITAKNGVVHLIDKVLGWDETPKVPSTTTTTEAVTTTTAVADARPTTTEEPELQAVVVDTKEPKVVTRVTEPSSTEDATTKPAVETTETGTMTTTDTSITAGSLEETTMSSTSEPETLATSLATDDKEERPTSMVPKDVQYGVTESILLTDSRTTPRTEGTSADVTLSSTEPVAETTSEADYDRTPKVLDQVSVTSVTSTGVTDESPTAATIIDTATPAATVITTPRETNVTEDTVSVTSSTASPGTEPETVEGMLTTIALPEDAVISETTSTVSDVTTATATVPLTSVTTVTDETVTYGTTDDREVKLLDVTASSVKPEEEDVTSTVTVPVHHATEDVTASSIREEDLGPTEEITSGTTPAVAQATVSLPEDDASPGDMVPVTEEAVVSSTTTTSIVQDLVTRITEAISSTLLSITHAPAEEVTASPASTLVDEDTEEAVTDVPVIKMADEIPEAVTTSTTTATTIRADKALEYETSAPVKEATEAGVASSTPGLVELENVTLSIPDVVQNVSASTIGPESTVSIDKDISTSVPLAVTVTDKSVVTVSGTEVTEYVPTSTRRDQEVSSTSTSDAEATIGLDEDTVSTSVPTAAVTDEPVTATGTERYSEPGTLADVSLTTRIDETVSSTSVPEATIGLDEDTAPVVVVTDEPVTITGPEVYTEPDTTAGVSLTTRLEAVSSTGVPEATIGLDEDTASTVAVTDEPVTVAGPEVYIEPGTMAGVSLTTRLEAVSSTGVPEATIGLDEDTVSTVAVTDEPVTATGTEVYTETGTLADVSLTTRLEAVSSTGVPEATIGLDEDTASTVAVTDEPVTVAGPEVYIEPGTMAGVSLTTRLEAVSSTGVPEATIGLDKDIASTVAVTDEPVTVAGPEVYIEPGTMAGVLLTTRLEAMSSTGVPEATISLDEDTVSTVAVTATEPVTATGTEVYTETGTLADVSLTTRLEAVSSTGVPEATIGLDEDTASTVAVTDEPVTVAGPEVYIEPGTMAGVSLTTRLEAVSSTGVPKATISLDEDTVSTVAVTDEPVTATGTEVYIEPGTVAGISLTTRLEAVSSTGVPEATIGLDEDTASTVAVTDEPVTVAGTEVYTETGIMADVSLTTTLTGAVSSTSIPEATIDLGEDTALTTAATDGPHPASSTQMDTELPTLEPVLLITRLPEVSTTSPEVSTSLDIESTSELAVTDASTPEALFDLVYGIPKEEDDDTRYATTSEVPSGRGFGDIYPSMETPILYIPKDVSEDEIGLRQSVNFTKVPAQAGLLQTLRDLNLTMLSEFLANSSIGGDLEDGPAGRMPLTIFAPTDDAFKDIDDATLKRLSSDLEQLKRVLLYHVVPSRVTGDNLPKAIQAGTLAGAPVFITVHPIDGRPTPLINNATIHPVQHETTNDTVIFVIDKVLTALPEGDLFTTINKFVHENVMKDHIVDTRLDPVMTGPGLVTVFVPTDDAWNGLPQDVRDRLSTDMTALKRYVLNHIVRGAVFTPALTNDAQFRTLAGNFLNVTHDADDASRIYVNGGLIVQPDIVATNGVVHVIDVDFLDEATLLEATTTTSVDLSTVPGATVVLEDTTTVVDVTGLPSTPTTEVPETLVTTTTTEASTTVEDELQPLLQALRRDNLTTFADLLESIYAPKILNLYGLFTLFAPTNRAIESLPSDELRELESDPQALQQMLLHHAVSGILPYRDITDKLEVTSIQGTNLTFNVYDDDDGRVEKTVLGKVIIRPDVMVMDGFVHIIDDLLYPVPREKLLQTVDGRFPSFMTAVNSTTDRRLFQDRPLTLFVPTETSWDKLQPSVKQDLLSNETFLNDLVMDHACQGRIFYRGIRQDEQCLTLSGKTLNFSVTDDNKYVNSVPIVMHDIITKDGVIHVIERPIYPEIAILEEEDITGTDAPETTLDGKITTVVVITDKVTSETTDYTEPSVTWKVYPTYPGISSEDITDESIATPEVTETETVTEATVTGGTESSPITGITEDVRDITDTPTVNDTDAELLPTREPKLVDRTLSTIKIAEPSTEVTTTVAEVSATPMVLSEATTETTDVPSTEIEHFKTESATPDATATEESPIVTASVPEPDVTSAPETTEEPTITDVTSELPEHLTPVVLDEVTYTAPEVMANVSGVTPIYDATTASLEDVTDAVGEVTSIAYGIVSAVSDVTTVAYDLPPKTYDVSNISEVILPVSEVTPGPEVTSGLDVTSPILNVTSIPDVTSPVPDVKDVTSPVPDVTTIADMTSTVSEVTIETITQPDNDTGAISYATMTTTESSTVITDESATDISEDYTSLSTTTMPEHETDMKTTTTGTTPVEDMTSSPPEPDLPEIYEDFIPENATLIPKVYSAMDATTAAPDVDISVNVTREPKRFTDEVQPNTTASLLPDEREVTTVMPEKDATTSESPAKISSITTNDTIQSILEQQFQKMGYRIDASSLDSRMPDGEVFTACLPYSTFLLSLDQEFIYNLLNNQTFTGELFADHMCPATVIHISQLKPNASCTSLNGDTIQILKDGDNYYCNGQRIVKPDLGAINGIVHLIDGILLEEAPHDITSSPTIHDAEETPITSKDILPEVTEVTMPSVSASGTIPELTSEISYAVTEEFTSTVTKEGEPEPSTTRMESVTVAYDYTTEFPELEVNFTTTLLPPSNNTIATVIQDEFRAAGISFDVSVINSIMPDRYLYTAFIPYRLYVETLPANLLDVLMFSNTAVIEFFAYHICPEETFSDQFVDGYTCTTIGGNPIVVTDYDGQYYVNGFPVVQPDIRVSDGVVHLIDGVLVAAAQNVTSLMDVTTTTSTRLPETVPEQTTQPEDSEFTESVTTAVTSILTSTIKAIEETDGISIISNVTIPAESQVTEEPVTALDVIVPITITRGPKILNDTTAEEIDETDITTIRAPAETTATETVSSDAVTQTTPSPERTNVTAEYKEPVVITRSTETSTAEYNETRSIIEVTITEGTGIHESTLPTFTKSPKETDDPDVTYAATSMLTISTEAIAVSTSSPEILNATETTTAKYEATDLSTKLLDDMSITEMPTTTETFETTEVSRESVEVTESLATEATSETTEVHTRLTKVLNVTDTPEPSDISEATEPQTEYRETSDFTEASTTPMKFTEALTEISEVFNITEASIPTVTYDASTYDESPKIFEYTEVPTEYFEMLNMTGVPVPRVTLEVTTVPTREPKLLNVTEPPTPFREEVNATDAFTPSVISEPTEVPTEYLEDLNVTEISVPSVVIIEDIEVTRLSKDLYMTDAPMPPDITEATIEPPIELPKDLNITETSIPLAAPESTEMPKILNVTEILTLANTTEAIEVPTEYSEASTATAISESTDTPTELLEVLNATEGSTPSITPEVMVTTTRFPKDLYVTVTPLLSDLSEVTTEISTEFPSVLNITETSTPPVVSESTEVPKAFLDVLNVSETAVTYASTETMGVPTRLPEVLEVTETTAPSLISESTESPTEHFDVFNVTETAITSVSYKATDAPTQLPATLNITETPFMILESTEIPTEYGDILNITEDAITIVTSEATAITTRLPKFLNLTDTPIPLDIPEATTEFPALLNITETETPPVISESTEIPKALLDVSNVTEAAVPSVTPEIVYIPTGVVEVLNITEISPPSAISESTEIPTEYLAAINVTEASVPSATSEVTVPSVTFEATETFTRGPKVLNMTETPIPSDTSEETEVPTESTQILNITEASTPSIISESTEVPVEYLDILNITETPVPSVTSEIVYTPTGLAEVTVSVTDISTPSTVSESTEVSTEYPEVINITEVAVTFVTSKVTVPVETFEAAEAPTSLPKILNITETPIPTDISEAVEVLTEFPQILNITETETPPVISEYTELPVEFLDMLNFTETTAPSVTPEIVHIPTRLVEVLNVTEISIPSKLTEYTEVPTELLETVNFTEAAVSSVTSEATVPSVTSEATEAFTRLPKVLNMTETPIPLDISEATDVTIEFPEMLNISKTSIPPIISEPTEVPLEFLVVLNMTETAVPLATPEIVYIPTRLAEVVNVTETSITFAISESTEIPTEYPEDVHITEAIESSVTSQGTVPSVTSEATVPSVTPEATVSSVTSEGTVPYGTSKGTVPSVPFEVTEASTRHPIFINVTETLMPSAITEAEGVLTEIPEILNVTVISTPRVFSESTAIPVETLDALNVTETPVPSVTSEIMYILTKLAEVLNVTEISTSPEISESTEAPTEYLETVNITEATVSSVTSKVTDFPTRWPKVLNMTETSIPSETTEAEEVPTEFPDTLNITETYTTPAIAESTKAPIEISEVFNVTETAVPSVTYDAADVTTILQVLNITATSPPVTTLKHAEVPTEFAVTNVTDIPSVTYEATDIPTRLSEVLNVTDSAIPSKISDTTEISTELWEVSNITGMEVSSVTSEVTDYPTKRPDIVNITEASVPSEISKSTEVSVEYTEVVSITEDTVPSVTSEVTSIPVISKVTEVATRLPKVLNVTESPIPAYISAATEAPTKYLEILNLTESSTVIHEDTEIPTEFLEELDITETTISSIPSEVTYMYVPTQMPEIINKTEISTPLVPYETTEIPTTLPELIKATEAETPSVTVESIDVPTLPELNYTEATVSPIVYETTDIVSRLPTVVNITEPPEPPSTNASTYIPTELPDVLNYTVASTPFVTFETTDLPTALLETLNLTEATIPSLIYEALDATTGLPDVFNATEAISLEAITIKETSEDTSLATSPDVEISTEAPISIHTPRFITTKYPDVFNLTDTTTSSDEVTKPSTAVPHTDVTTVIPFYPAGEGRGQLSVSVFFYLIELSDVDEILAQGGPYTILAPVDSAFQELPPQVMNRLEDNVPFLKEVMLYHILPTKIMSTDLHNDNLLTTLQGQDVRCNVYGPVITIGGSRIVLPDSDTGYGVVHIVNKVLYPLPSGTALDTLIPRNDTDKVQFLISNSSLPQRLREPGSYTVFIPSDRALERLPSSFINALERNSSLLEDFVLNHMVNGTYYTEGMTEGLELQSVGGQLLRISKSGGLTLNGVPIVTPDISVTNGVVHVVDMILYNPLEGAVTPRMQPTVSENMNVVQLSRQLNLTKFANYLTNSGLDVHLREPGPYTLFAPTDDAFDAMPRTQLDRIATDVDHLQRVLMYHVVPDRVSTMHMTNEMLVPSLLPNKTVRMNIYVDERGPMYTASGSPIIIPNNVASNGLVHVIQQVLYIPLGDIVQTVERCSILQTLRHIITVSGLTDDLKVGNYTLLAPNDAAFNKLPEDVLNRLIVDPALAKSFVLGHLLRGTIYTEGIFDETSMSTLSGNSFYIRALKDCILLNSAAIQYPDVTADNGAVHVIDRVL